jgi:hypothetical protein
MTETISVQVGSIILKFCLCCSKTLNIFNMSAIFFFLLRYEFLTNKTIVMWK